MTVPGATPSARPERTIVKDELVALATADVDLRLLVDQSAGRSPDDGHEEAVDDHAAYRAGMDHLLPSVMGGHLTPLAQARFARAATRSAAALAAAASPVPSESL